VWAANRSAIIEPRTISGWRIPPVAGFSIARRLDGVLFVLFAGNLAGQRRPDDCSEWLGQLLAVLASWPRCDKLRCTFSRNAWSPSAIRIRISRPFAENCQASSWWNTSVCRSPRRCFAGSTWSVILPYHGNLRNRTENHSANGGFNHVRVMMALLESKEEKRKKKGHAL